MHQGRKIRATIHDGRTGEHPVALGAELLDGLGLLGLAVPQSVRLITHHAPKMHGKGVLSRGQLVVIGHVDLVRTLAHKGIPPRLLVEDTHTELANSGDTADPLMYDGKRAQDQCGPHRVLM